jgi:hypothetical protein
MKIGRPKIDLDFIKNKFLEEGYTVLSNLYKGSKDKIEFIVIWRRSAKVRL